MSAVLACGCCFVLPSASGAARDPFWPVGYRPSATNDDFEVEESSGAVDWARARKSIQVLGVSVSGGKPSAIVGDDIKHVGETVSVVCSGVRYTWVIEKIVPPSYVKFRPLATE